VKATPREPGFTRRFPLSPDVGEAPPHRREHHPGDGQDVFVHYSAIQASGFRSLAEGDRVEFEVTRGPKGLQASNVKKV
jgi:cold shock CspA family protein